MYYHRTLEHYFNKVNHQFPVMFIAGARQVGKTTFLRKISEKTRSYITLDDPLIRNLAQQDPALFMQRYQPPLLIDEIQYAPELLPYIKMAVDHQQKPNLFWLTGSQPLHLMNGISESLAGRVGIIQMLGFSLRETTQQANYQPFVPTLSSIQRHMKDANPLSLNALFQKIWQGAFPKMALQTHTDRHLFFSSYVQTYLQRDVRDLAQVGDEMAFLRFLRAAAARTAQLLNITELARDADISPNTAKNWLSVLKASGIVYLLEPYHSNITKRLVKTPKLYFLDTGLCAYLTEWSNSATLEAGAMSGPILETWIITELLKGWLHNGRQPPFYFYRDKDQKEIDLLIVEDDTIFPIELKKTASPSRKDIRHFQALNRFDKKLGEGVLICLSEHSLPLTDKVSTMPAWAI